MPTIRETEYPYERYVNGTLQVSNDGHDWSDYIIPTVSATPWVIPATITFSESGRLIYRGVLKDRHEINNKESNLSPFQQWENSINE
jgi:hypothetical protein